MGEEKQQRMMWLSVDPMLDKYPGISPYHYCHWNPIRLIDPDGMEDWEVDRSGHITKCEVQPENPTEDRIRVKGTEGWTEKNSLSGLTRGTISEQYSRTLGNISGSIVYLGGQQADQESLFMFCADHSDVEYSLIVTRLNDGRVSYLTTSHDVRSPSKAFIGDRFGSNVSLKVAPVMILHLHNHFGSGQAGWGASTSDLDFRDEVKRIQGKLCGTNKVDNTTFGIYKCRGADRRIVFY